MKRFSRSEKKRPENVQNFLGEKLKLTVFNESEKMRHVKTAG